MHKTIASVCSGEFISHHWISASLEDIDHILVSTSLRNELLSIVKWLLCNWNWEKKGCILIAVSCSTFTEYYLSASAPGEGQTVYNSFRYSGNRLQTLTNTDGWFTVQRQNEAALSQTYCSPSPCLLTLARNIKDDIEFAFIHRSVILSNRKVWTATKQ